MIKQLIISVSLVCLLTTTNEVLNAQQKVGIGTNIPTELLDVNGNINVNGKIKLNGSEGQPGDVLKVGADGNPSWSIARQFNTFCGHYNLSTSLTIPSTAKKVMIEAWGAGGGGAQGGGGASGQYAMGVFTITEATNLTITVGTGGTGSLTYTGAAADGLSTSVTGTGISVTASGGKGANQYYGGLLPNSGFLGGSVSGLALLQSIRLNGENGQPTTYQSFQFSSTVWQTAVQFGRGGNPPLGIGNGGFGCFRVHNNTEAPDGIFIKIYQGGFAGIAGGGGGGQALGSGWGHAGGRGYVIVRY